MTTLYLDFIYMLFIWTLSALVFFFSSSRRHTIWTRDWSSDVCSSDLETRLGQNQRNVRGRIHNFCRTDRIDLHHHVHARHGPGHGATHVDRARYTPEPAHIDLF